MITLKSVPNSEIFVNDNKTVSRRIISKFFQTQMWSLHKKWSFPLRISSVNVTKSAASCGFGHIYWRNPQCKSSFFVQWIIKIIWEISLLFDFWKTWQPCAKLRCKKDTETKIRFGSKFTTLHQKVMKTAAFEKHNEGEDRCYALIECGLKLLCQRNLLNNPHLRSMTT